MCKDYFKRLTTTQYTCWDLNCRNVIPHTKSLNSFEKTIRRHARRTDKMFLSRGIDICAPV